VENGTEVPCSLCLYESQGKVKDAVESFTIDKRYNPPIISSERGREEMRRGENKKGEN
jgi:hypothetical protein